MGPKGKRQLGNNPLFSKILNILCRSEKNQRRRVSTARRSVVGQQAGVTLGLRLDQK